MIAYFSNFLIGTEDIESWRWMLGVEVIPATLVFNICVYSFPRAQDGWLIAKNRIDEAKEILRIINPGTALKSR
jgi:hypothetical protein